MKKQNHLDDKTQFPSSDDIVAVDLFCGVGGLTHGLRNVGIDVVLGIDNDSSCVYPYTENNNTSFLLKAIENVNAKDLPFSDENSSINILAGCAPCQPFSKYNKAKKQTNNSNDNRWWLLLEFARLVVESEPDIVTMENVPGLIKQDVFKEFVNVLSDHNYFINYSVVNSADYGVPQRRKRLVLLASKHGPIKLLDSETLGKRRVSVREAIGNLPILEAGNVSEKDPLHQCASLSPLNLKRIRSSSPNGSWRDWDDELVATCHKRNSGKTYSSVYGRMSWDSTAPTMTTQFIGYGNGRFGHPEQDRAISLREGAIFQGFPESYSFCPPTEIINRRKIAKLIGNAVPVQLGEAIGKSILEHINCIVDK